MPTKVGIHVFLAAIKDVDRVPAYAITVASHRHLKWDASVIIGPSDIEPSSL